MPPRFFRGIIEYGNTAQTEGNTVQRASGDFARHLLAKFSSYFTKNLTTHLSHNLCAVLPEISKAVFIKRNKYTYL
ncbi:hypothetical protein DXB92_04290 [Ruminococcus sp. OM06-36AC]|nr:hypothetical protein DXB92_04290 [Ruminococcus sp. OM06-36AC]